VEKSSSTSNSSAALAADLARSLEHMAAAIDQARSAGLSVHVPEALYLACCEIVSRYQDPAGQREPARRPDLLASGRGGRMARAASLHDVPLRRLVWQVLDPGEEFTVADVTKRLAGLGISLPANKVSNALGYWVSRGRLARQRKGTYSYPIIPVPSHDASERDARKLEPAECGPMMRKEDWSRSHIESTQRRAM
jgi:hypothetical protein